MRHRISVLLKFWPFVRQSALQFRSSMRVEYFVWENSVHEEIVPENYVKNRVHGEIYLGNYVRNRVHGESSRKLRQKAGRIFDPGSPDASCLPKWPLFRVNDCYLRLIKGYDGFSFLTGFTVYSQITLEFWPSISRVRSPQDEPDLDN